MKARFQNGTALEGKRNRAGLVVWHQTLSQQWFGLGMKSLLGAKARFFLAVNVGAEAPTPKDQPQRAAPEEYLWDGS